ncbi:hypothetical protein V5799_032432 [Amblyomma americanum]|uniref:Uncharacterized protein n=1 Tax=Amblyomma americanum TaxID=6943 RepID=A0AAQ4DR66_AMBAM
MGDRSAAVLAPRQPARGHDVQDSSSLNIRRLPQNMKLGKGPKTVTLMDATEVNIGPRKRAHGETKPKPASSCEIPASRVDARPGNLATQRPFHYSRRTPHKRTQLLRCH